ncbi:MAG: ATP-binding protein [Planctomycetota bacterium]|jgi:PAS domain S-box-containing protein
MRLSPILFLVSGVMVASPARATGGLQDAWRWIEFFEASGLPSSFVNIVIPLAEDEIWAATNAGLAVYDNYQWHRVGDEGVVQGADPRFFRGHGHVAWFVVGGRIYRCENRAVERFRYRVGKWELRVRSMAAVENSGLLAVGRVGPNGPMRLFHLAAGTVQETPSPLDDVSGDLVVADIWKTELGNIWLTTPRGLFLQSGDEWVLKHEGSGENLKVTNLQESANGSGVAYVSHSFNSRYIWQWDQSGSDRESRQGAGAVSAMAISPEGEVVVSFDSGQVWARTDDQWRQVDPLPHGLTTVESLAFESNGDLWVATHHGLFLFKAKSRRWEYLDESRDEDSSMVSDVTLAKDGTIWFTDQYGVRSIGRDGTRTSFLEFEGKLLHGLTAIAEDRDGNIWTSGGENHRGVFRWDGISWKHFGKNEGFDVDLVHRMRRDRQGRLWFLCIDRSEVGNEDTGPGAFFVEDGEIRYWEHNHELPNNRIYAFEEDAEGAYWFGTYRSLSRYKDGQWRHWFEEDGIRASTVFTLSVDANGSVWFANQLEGLGHLYKDGRIEYFTESDWLADDEVWETKFGPSGDLWVSTCSGLCRFDGESWDVFSSRAGLRNACVWPILPLSDRVIFGTIGSGLAVLSLEEERLPPPRIVLGTPSVAQGSVRISWQTYPYRSDSRSDNTRVRWRLDQGLWSPWSRRHSATISDISGGRHDFEVQAMGLLGNVTPQGSLTTFDIPYWPFQSVLLYGSVGGISISLLLLGLLLFRHRREEALRKSTVRLSALAQEQQLLLDHTRDFLYRHNRLGEFEYLSPSVEQITGYTANHFARHYTEYMTDSPVNRRVLEITAQTLEEGGDSPVYHVEIRHKNGNVITLEVNERAYYEDGAVAGIIGVARDVTERVKVEEKLREAIETAERASQSKSEFLANVSHEIRTPIMAMLGAAELAGARDLTGDVKPREIIIRNGRHLLSLINEVLDAAHQEVGYLPVVMAECSIFDIYEDIVAAVPPVRSQGTVDFSVVVETEVPRMVVTDRTRVAQAVINLVNNALKYTESGYVRVSIRANRRTTPSELEFAVADTGPGISEQAVDKIFQKFVQLQKDEGGVGRGVGLGLPLAKMIAEKLDGRIHVKSRVGKGSVFTLTIAADTPATDWVAPEDFDAQRAEIRAGSKEFADRLIGRVLLAEDFDDTRALIEEALTVAGVDVVSVVDGQQAVEAALHREFDLLLMDVRMPNMGGVEATRELRKRGIQTPIIALTASTEPSERERLLDVGFDDFWPKPISLARLIDNTSILLSKAGADPAGPVSDSREDDKKLDAHARLAAAISRYAVALPDRCAQILAAVESGQRDEACELLHQLVGSAGIHGFDAVSAVAVTALGLARVGKLAPEAPELLSLKEATLRARESVQDPQMNADERR